MGLSKKIQKYTVAREIQIKRIGLVLLLLQHALNGICSNLLVLYAFVCLPRFQVPPSSARLSLSLVRWALPMTLARSIEAAEEESECVDVSVSLLFSAMLFWVMWQTQQQPIHFLTRNR